MKLGFLKYLFIVLIVISCSNDDPATTSNTPEIISVESFGGSNNDSAQSVIATIDGGYAVMGYTQSNDGDITDKQDTSFDFWVIKFNAQNIIEWQKTYGGSADDRGNCIIQTSDGGFALLGFSFSDDIDVTNNEGLQDFWLVRLDAFGNLLWQKSYGFEGADSGISIIETNDQGFLLSGIIDVTASGGQGATNKALQKHAGGDYWLLKVDEVGSLEWSNYFGGNFTDTPYGIIQKENNGYLILGSSDSSDTDISNNLGSYDFWLIDVAPDGTLISEKSFGGTQIDEGRAIIATPDGNYLLAGDTRSNDVNISSNNGGADLWLAKVSPSGNLIWERNIGGSNFDVARAIKSSKNGNFILAGSSRSSDVDVASNKGQNDAWVLKIDGNGEVIWERTIGGSNIDFAYDVAQLNDGSIIAVGDTTSDDGDIIVNKGFTDLLVIKIEN
ncbi:hypothetical protein [Winogradskyella alexanderae]|uniref:Bulb-type lectin domain-containing protein n=1 Tax=Winogradskyella alexanderae TaxID=2877123 RepID=A0ABS7XMD0_9FLAO|nr:hypothetical protein [Winogradskyella alexanderae]MCA0131157.1 hypothetical protein [Winogradskyella alexanderae]